MSCQDCLNRRGFLAKSALAAAALVVAEGCGDGQIGPTIPRRSGSGDPFVPVSPPVTVDLANEPALATVGQVVDIGSQRALVRTGPASFLGLSRICTHQGCDTEVRSNEFQCPCHGSVFSATGTVIRGPNIQSGPIAPLSQLTASFDPVTNTVTVA
jgi:cytochrome b6-f complex iron-sulfur subunit